MSTRTSDSETPFVLDPSRWAKVRIGSLVAIITIVIGATVWSVTVKADLELLKGQNVVFSQRMDIIESRAQQEREFRIQLAEGVNYIVRSIDQKRGDRSEKPAPIVPPTP